MVHQVAIPFSRRLRTVTLMAQGETLPVNLPRLAIPTPKATPPAPPPVDPAIVQEREDLANLIGNLNQLGEDLRSQQAQRLQEMQQVAIEVALAVAGHLLHKEIASGEFVERLVARVVGQLEGQQAVAVYLNPEDIKLLENRADANGHDLLEINPGLRLIGDASISRGDCRAETGDLSIASRLEEQLAAIRTGLMESVPATQVERRKARPTTIRRFPERRQTA